jgi:hypothetical protein
MYLLNQLFELRKNAKQRLFSCLSALSLGYSLLLFQSIAIANEIGAGEMIEYKVKAAFIYNFIAFTQWPENTDQTINLCIYGEDYFGDRIDKLQDKPVNNRYIKIMRMNSFAKLKECQVVFFSKSVKDNLPRILSDLRNTPILTLADSPDVARQGIIINMNLLNEKIVFEVDLEAARNSGLNLSSKLLQLAIRVHQ